MASQNPRFGKYALVSKLGMGGMAEVFKAQHIKSPDVVVAIKRILPQYSQDKKLISMLVNEARLTVGLSHPNVVPMLDFGIVDGVYFIAMEYVRGRDLKSIMIRCKMRNVTLPVPMAIFIMSQVLRGLDYAHHKRDNFDQPLLIVHRDISPQNVLISLWGQTKILDFGIAKAASKAGETQAGILKGKFSYMSPEQAQGEDVDPRTDLFSAGVVLWELLTLESCFQADTDIKLLEKVREADIRVPSSVNAKVSKALDRIIMKALEKKPKKRYQTAGDFASELESFQRESFGTVTEGDVAAFLRTLFDISPGELDHTPRPGVNAEEDLLKGGLEKALEETFAAPPPSQSSGSRQGQVPWIKGPSQWLWKIPLLLSIALSVTVALWFFPPRRIFAAYDHQVLKLARKIHVWRAKKSQADLPVTEIKLPPAPASLYALKILPSASADLEDLPFETFELIRNQMMDLANDPRPRGSDPVSDRPGLLTITQAGYQIIYRLVDQPKTVVVEKIQKAG